MAIQNPLFNNPFPSVLPCYTNNEEMLNSDANLDESMFLDRTVNPPLLPRKRMRESVSFLGEDLSLQMIQQQLEIDRLIFLYTENLRLGLEEQMKNQSRRTIIAIEQKIAKILINKEEQIRKIGKLNATLQDRVRSLYLENQLWRDLAQSNEATANVLRSNLEDLLLQVNNTKIEYDVISDDVESCCGSNGIDVKDDVDIEVEEERILEWTKSLCRSCGGRESCVLVLPCRHLCLCTACGPMVDACPICNVIKNATIHVNFS